jgi:hypothetical protein
MEIRDAAPIHEESDMNAVKTDTLLAVRAGRLFDGEQRWGPSTVLIGGGRIIDVDSSTDVVAGIGALNDSQLLAQMAQAASRTLQAGITTVRDLGDRSFLALALRDQLDAWVDLGPEIVASARRSPSVAGIAISSAAWLTVHRSSGPRCRTGPSAAARW